MSKLKKLFVKKLKEEKIKEAHRIRRMIERQEMEKPYLIYDIKPTHNNSQEVERYLAFGHWHIINKDCFNYCGKAGVLEKNRTIDLRTNGDDNKTKLICQYKSIKKDLL